MKSKYLVIKLIAIVVFLVASVVLASSYWLTNIFGLVNLETIIFNFMVSIKGADSILIRSYAVYLAIALVLTAIYSALILKLGRNKKAFIALLALSFSWLLAAAYYIEHNHGIYAYFNRPDSQFIEEEYVRVKPEQITLSPLAGGNPRNLIFLVLESAEETFNNPTLLSQPLMPQLDALRRENTSFYGYEPLFGTRISIAAISSFLLGIPLKIPIDENTYDNTNFTSFLPGTLSIMRPLEDYGYKIDIFMGLSGQYSGEDNFIRTHAQNATLHDLAYFEQQYHDVNLPENKGLNWGVKDAYLYRRVKEFLSENYDKGRFFVMIQTVDSHIPSGYVEPGIKRRWNDIRDSFAEASKMAYDFVTWAQKQPFAPNTTIVVIGDHLFMKPKLGNVRLPPDPHDFPHLVKATDPKREIYNVFINPVPRISVQQQQRSFSAVDIAPTLLESIGFNVPDGKFGLGVSLFRSNPTLIEQFGYTRVDSEFGAKSAFYQNFYFYPEE